MMESGAHRFDDGRSLAVIDKLIFDVRRGAYYGISATLPHAGALENVKFCFDFFNEAKLDLDENVSALQCRQRVGAVPGYSNASLQMDSLPNADCGNSYSAQYQPPRK